MQTAIRLYQGVKAAYLSVETNEGNAVKTVDITKPLLELHIEVSPNGEVTPVVPISWTFSEKLVQAVTDLRYSNPYIILIVASRHEDTYGNQSTYSYDPTRIYAVNLTDTPKAYVQFSRPGDNVIIAAIVDMNSSSKAKAISNWLKHPDRMYFTVNETTQNLEHLDEFYIEESISTIQQVTVPKQLFASPPPKFLRTLVVQFFPAYVRDQCNFRKRVILSTLMSIPVQIYGVFARLLTLFYGVFMLDRGMRVRSFFALNPHDFARAFQGSFWIVDKNLRWRKNFWKWLSPPALVLYLVGLAITWIVLSIVPFLTMMIKYNGEYDANFSWGEYLLTGLIGDVIVALLIAVLWMVISKSGKRFVADVHWWFVDRFVNKNVGNQSQREATKLTREQQLNAQLTMQARNGANFTKPEDVKDNSIKLVFYNVKRRVCKPFAN